jgi:hypothetical protein
MQVFRVYFDTIMLSYEILGSQEKRNIQMQQIHYLISLTGVDSFSYESRKTEIEFPSLV